MAVIVSYFPSEGIINNIKKLEMECKEILIVDNGSSGESLMIIHELEKREKVKVLYCKENLGIAAALNIGLKYAYDQGFEWLLTFDQDSLIITEDYGFTLATVVENDFGLENVAVIGGNYPKPLDPENPNKDRYPPATGKVTSREVNTVITSGNLLQLDEIKSTNVFFDEELFIDYVDFDFCLALKDKGKRIVQVLDGKFEHIIGNPIYKTINGERIIIPNHSYIRKYYLFRNSTVVHNRYSQYEDWVSYSENNIKKLFRLIDFEDDDIFRKVKSALLGIEDAKKEKLGKFDYQF